MIIAEGLHRFSPPYHLPSLATYPALRAVAGAAQSGCPVPWLDRSHFCPSLLCYGIRQSRFDWAEGVAHLPGLHDLRLQEMAANGCWTSRRAGRSSARPSRPASTSSTRRTCIRSARARRSSGGAPSRSSGRRATGWSSPPRSSTRWATTRTSAAFPASISAMRLTTACGGLQTDYVDLYQIHRFDPATPMEETLEALTMSCAPARRSTWARRPCGPGSSRRCSRLAGQRGWPRFVTMQNHYNLLYREEEREMIPLCRAEGIGLIPWSPLARGLLARSRQAGTVRAKTDDYRRQPLRARPPSLTTRSSRRVQTLAAAKGVSARADRLGLAAPQARGHRADRWRFQAAAHRGRRRGLDVKLSAEEIASLEEPYVPHPVAGHE